MATVVTAPPPVPPARPAPGSERRGPRRPDPRRLAAGRSTPSVIQTMIAGIVLLSLAWGGLSAWAVATHSSAATSLAYSDEPYSQEAQKLYLAVADADVTITTSFLAQAQPVSSGQQPPSSLAARQRLAADIASASHYLAELMNGGGNAQLAQAAAAFDADLAAYQGYVATAETEYAQGTIPAGDSEMEVASEEAHLGLLPEAKLIYNQEITAVDASRDQATSLPTIVIAVLIGLAALAMLLWAQRWMARRTHRVFNLGLVIATAALVISIGWLAVTFGLASSDLSTAVGQGANPAEALAQASIDVQQIRGDSILNVIARSGSPSLQTDSAAQAKNVGPGSGSLLSSASAAGNGPVTADLATAITAAPAWYKANGQGYALGSQHQYSAELESVMGNQVSSEYGQVTGSIGQALDAAQQTFTTQADNASSAFGPLEAAVIIAALVMVVASAWGLSRRLAEYR
ncbi:MAG TPA: hypothetical protein VMU95_05315 [Trebonia sp.]|nr:hypothetical protein [Trebonia sp.]